MSEQTTIDVRPPDLATARAVGQIAGELAAARAERDVPDFRARVMAAVLDRLKAGPASGETLTEYVGACGVPFKDGRSLGPIYKAMKDDGLIRIVGECNRRFGHGSPGGHVYEGCFNYSAQKLAWLAAHPDAPGEQIERACQRIAERLGV